MDLYKIIKYIAYALGIIGAVLALMIMAGVEGMIENILYVTYITLFLIIVLVLVYVLKGLFTGNVKKTLKIVGAFLLIVVVSYLVSSGTDLDLTPFHEKGLDITEATSKYVSTGLHVFYILAILAVGSMLMSGLSKINNNK